MRLLGLPLVLVLLPFPAAPQSLGEAARKEEERRQKNKEKGVKAPLFDESKIPKKAPPPAASPAASPGAETGGATAAPGPAIATIPEPSSGDADAEQRLRQEEMWRGRMTAARARRDEAKHNHDYLNSLWLGPSEYFVDNKGTVIVRDVDHLRQLISQAKAEWDAAEKAISDLEESARRAGALPGWLR